MTGRLQAVHFQYRLSSNSKDDKARFRRYHSQFFLEKPEALGETEDDIEGNLGRQLEMKVCLSSEADRLRLLCRSIQPETIQSSESPVETPRKGTMFT
jgi:hypothetical protein